MDGMGFVSASVGDETHPAGIAGHGLQGAGGRIDAVDAAEQPGLRVARVVEIVRPDRTTSLGSIAWTM